MSNEARRIMQELAIRLIDSITDKEIGSLQEANAVKGLIDSDGLRCFGDIYLRPIYLLIRRAGDLPENQKRIIFSRIPKLAELFNGLVDGDTRLTADEFQSVLLKENVPCSASWVGKGLRQRPRAVSWTSIPNVLSPRGDTSKKAVGDLVLEPDEEPEEAEQEGWREEGTNESAGYQGEANEGALIEGLIAQREIR